MTSRSCHPSFEIGLVHRLDGFAALLWLEQNDVKYCEASTNADVARPNIRDFNAYAVPLDSLEDEMNQLGHRRVEL